MTEPAPTPPPSDLFEGIKNLLLRSWWGLLVLAAFTIWWQWDKIEKLPFVAAILERFTRRKLPAADQLGFSIALAHLENDTGHGHEKLLLAELEKIKGVKVLPLDRTIKLPEDGAVQDSVEAGHRQAREFLKTSHADALLWGSVLKVSGKEAMQLRWTASAEGPAATGSGRYQADPDLNLPPLFWSDLGKVIGLIVTTRSSFLYESGTYLVDRIRPFISSVRQILANPQANWSDDDRAGLTFALAQALNGLGAQAGDNQALKDSAEQYRQVLAFWTRDSKKLEWAAAQNNLGTALQCLGERESTTKNLHLAVAAYQQALEEYTREKVPLSWATTKNNLGNALLALGERESGTDTLHLAVAAYQQALEERTRDKVPLEWAATQNNLGGARLILGERESGPENLHLAVAAYNQALKERTRKKVPLDWAMTQNNLGAALESLGEREPELENLHLAVAAYNQALEERTRQKVPVDWAMTQSNLGSALRKLGERESGSENLHLAMAANRQALEEYTRDKVPLDWAATQRNLGTALLELGKRESSRALLRDAETALNNALSVFPSDYYHRPRAEAELKQVQREIAALQASGGK